MIFIAVKHRVRPEYASQWSELMSDFTTGTRAEPGAISFDWSRSLDDPNEIVLIEAFTDAAAAAAHVGTEHFKAAVARLPHLLVEAPRIVHADIAATGWATMSEFVARTDEPAR
jgi:quinol monooxygenase YgiN